MLLCSLSLFSATVFAFMMGLETVAAYFGNVGVQSVIVWTNTTFKGATHLISLLILILPITLTM